MRFKYKAINRDGDVHFDTREAANKDALYELLKTRGESLISIEEESEGGIDEWLSHIEEKMTRVKDEQIISFARNLGAMIEAGLPLSRALSVIERQSRNLKFKSIINSIRDNVQEGVPFSEALAKHDVFPPLFVSMVGSGQESGNIADSLQNIAGQMDRTYKLKKKIRGAMMYPAIVTIVMLIVAVIMLIFIVPTLSATFEELNVELPITTQIVIALSTFMREYTVLALATVVLFIGGLMYSYRTKKGREIVDKVIIKIPIMGELVREVNSARTAATLSSLLAAGVEIVEAIDITENVVQNVHYQRVLKEVRESVEKGTAMSEVFKKNEKLYPPFVSEMVAVGEETGKLSEVLGRVAAFYEDDVEQRTKDMSTIIEPILMVVVGAAVGFFAVSMITPMYSITSGL